jgi:hypothetical protein
MKTVTYNQALVTFRDLCEPLDECPPEYMRGGVNLLADLFGVKGMDTGERMEQIEADLLRTPFGAGADYDPMRLDIKSLAQAADYLSGLAEDGCTGHIEATPSGVYVHHDGGTCPIHEGPSAEPKENEHEDHG